MALIADPRGKFHPCNARMRRDRPAPPRRSWLPAAIHSPTVAWARSDEALYLRSERYASPSRRNLLKLAAHDERKQLSHAKGRGLGVRSMLFAGQAIGEGIAVEHMHR